MTTTHDRIDSSTHRAAPPLSRAVQVAVGCCLVAAGLLNGLSQYVGHVMAGDGIDDFSDQMRWWAAHPTEARVEQLALVASTLVMPIGLLGLLHLARRRSPRLTAVAGVLVLWGMWGFHNILAMGYVTGYVGPRELPMGEAVRLNDALTAEPGVVVTALLPHLVGSFIGLLLMCVACWRSGLVPRTPLVLLAGFLVWDFLLPAVGVLEPHLLLVVAWGWLGVHIVRMRPRDWRGHAY
jgi:hypothetical protein